MDQTKVVFEISFKPIRRLVLLQTGFKVSQSSDQLFVPLDRKQC